MKFKTIIVSGIVLIVLSFGIFCNRTWKKENLNANDRFVVAVAWFQNAAEYTALCYQSFNIARLRLDESILNQKRGKPLALVVDIDETMLDNSPFEVSLINNLDNLTGWYKWTAKASAKPIPGALEFVNYAKSKQVEVFYITNRDDNERLVTLKNLQNEEFPYADGEHLYTKSDLAYSSGNTSSKLGRRAKVAEKYEIVLLIGDNLNDFSEIFEDRSINNGKEAVIKNRDLFGQKYIMLPNPIYGAWEKPLYDYIDTLSDEAKTLKLKSKLKNE